MIGFRDPDIIVLGEMLRKIVLFVTCVGVALAESTTPAPPCERAPSHAQPADALYRLGIAGEPDLFLPGELYTGKYYLELFLRRKTFKSQNKWFSIVWSGP